MNSAWKMALTLWGEDGGGVRFLRRHNVCRQNSILNDERRHRCCVNDWLLHQDLVSYTVIRNVHNSTTARATLSYVCEWLDKKYHNVGRNSTRGPYITSNMFPCYTFSWSFVGAPLQCLHLYIFLLSSAELKSMGPLLLCKCSCTRIQRAGYRTKQKRRNNCFQFLFTLLFYSLCAKST